MKVNKSAKRQTKKIIFFGSYDVIVCGGGPAGVSAAFSAAEGGAKVLLLEQYGFLGGMATSGLPLLTFHDLNGNQTVGGFPQYLVEKLIEKGGSPGHVKIKDAHFSTFTPVDTEIFKLVAQEVLCARGVKIMFHCFVSDVICHDSEVKFVIFETKNGSFSVEGKAIVDATGDGDVAVRAGANFEYGAEDNYCQPMCLMFKLSNVDVDKLEQSFGEEIGLNPDTVKFPFFEKILHLTGTFSRWENKIKYYNLFNGEAKHRIWLVPFRKGEVSINTIKIFKNFLDMKEISEAEIEARKQVYDITNFLKKWVPGFENTYVSFTNCQIGLRETRRIIGDYILTGKDVEEGRIFPDTIALFGYPIDIHHFDGIDSEFKFIKDNGVYGVPYRILLPKNIENLIVAGRCVSATREAFASLRVMVGAMAIGQAAGAASCLKANKGYFSFREVPYSDLRRILLRQGAILNMKS